MKKKLKKLLRDPKLFVRDMFTNKARVIKGKFPKKLDASQKYTVISAVYNVSQYLEEYFNSLVKQRLDFRRNIQVILVDDGSTDESAEIIRRWQKKYPENIKYLKKKNGGQASARNFGIDFIETEWVTFIDPDDFLDQSYFFEVDQFFVKNAKKDLQLVSCNFIFYFEDKKQFKDTHPLKYRFSKGNQIVPLSDAGKNIQLSVNSAFFRRSIIVKDSIQFDARIKPNFEDAHFVANYFSGIKTGSIGFAEKAKYYYRKREDGTSTLDTAWKKEGLFGDVLEHGCLQMLKRYSENNGQVPPFIQRTVLYHLIWYIKRL
ncbi:MAG: glycosyltransferase family 2 protein, partial [Cytophagaceae bacterium]